MSKESIVNYLKSAFPEGRVVAGGSEYRCRCRFCGDSIRDKNAAHFYISLDKGALLYNCFKCNSSGILDSKTLSQITECYDGTIFKEIDTNNKRYGKSYQSINGLGSDFRRYNLFIENPINKWTQQKQAYINHRIGSDYSLKDLTRLKITLGYDHLIKTNNLIPNSNPSIRICLDRYCIGFVSVDNSLVTYRNIIYDAKAHDTLQKYRYIKESIQGKNVMSNTPYYVIPSTIDITKETEVIMAEGQFDILSIYHNIYNDNTKNRIFLAVGNKGYRNAIMFLLGNLGIMMPKLVIYSDSDVSSHMYIGIYKTILSPWNISMEVYYNGCSGEKDFGVTAGKIKPIRELCYNQ